MALGKGRISLGSPARMSTVTYLATATVALLLWKLLLRSSSQNRGLPLPPGPRRYPIIGNLLDAAQSKQWIQFDEWSKTYGSMVYIEILGKRFLVLHDMQACNDLFERKSSIYSSRPRMPMLSELMGWDWTLGLLPYGEDWRQRRKLFHRFFNVTQVQEFRPIQLKEARRMLVRLLHSPENFFLHVQHNLVASIMETSYGIPVEDSNNKYVRQAEKALDGFSEAGVPGSFMVDFFPWLAYVPAWVPGANFQRKAAKWRSDNLDMINLPFEAVKQAMLDGTAGPSVARTLIESAAQEADVQHAEFIAKGIVGTSYSGGADTTLSSLRLIFLALATHPEVQRRAQDEIDRVVGYDRLPNFGDLPSLPYVDALCKEIMRWKPVTPLSVAHCSTEDDEYCGYFIPKGTIVLVNVWTVFRNLVDYPDPEVFRPERFLTKEGQIDSTVRDPGTAAFGFGRRICPGRWFSAQTLFATVSSLLAVYNITPPLDNRGQPVQLEPKMNDGMIQHPLPFECNIKPRSDKAKALITDFETEDS